MARVQAALEHGLGRIRLNRPEALNALNVEMIAAIMEALARWREDAQVRAVVIGHEGARGFCAGGDVRAMAAFSVDRPDEVRAFFAAEYGLNCALFAYPKPVVALMDGVTMGGGAGFAFPARFRIATERTLFAMPEARIGLFPDAGAGWVLPRLPGRVGAWMALTAARLGPGDCLASGLATHAVASGDLEAALAAWEAANHDEAVFARFAQHPPPDALLAREDIDRLFTEETVEGVLAALHADGGAWALAQARLIDSMCPMTLKVTLREFAQGARATNFAAHMRLEYRLALRMTARPDFREGVRAALIDRDNAPIWSPPDLAGVTKAMLDDIFAPLSAEEDARFAP